MCLNIEGEVLEVLPVGINQNPYHRSSDKVFPYVAETWHIMSGWRVGLLNLIHTFSQLKLSHTSLSTHDMIMG